VTRPPLIARLLLDAQSEFARAADNVPADARDVRVGALNAAGWVVAHAAFIHDVWMNADGRGAVPADGCDPWLRAWFRRQRDAGRDPIDAPFDEARPALDRVVAKADPFVRSLTDAALDSVPDYEPGAFAPGTTLGYLVARDIAHLFAHASELIVIATSSGGVDIGLPGALRNTSDREETQ
jgi:hypothetical protein